MSQSCPPSPLSSPTKGRGGILWGCYFLSNLLPTRGNESLPSCAESQGLQTVDECARVPYEAPKERSGVCFGGFRPMKHVEEPRASTRGGSTLKGQPF